MEEQQTDQEKHTTIIEWFQNIMTIHGTPCYLLIFIDESGKAHLQAAATCGDELKFLVDHKQSYMR